MSLSVALEVARSNPITDLPKMGAVITNRRGLIIATGQNSRKTHPLAAKYHRHKDSACVHAEIAAICSALRTVTLEELNECDIFVARVFKNGEPALAKPCSGCQGAILEFGLRNVEWTI